MTTDAPHQKLREMVKEAGSQKAVAKQLKISRQYMCEVLNGRRDVSKSLAEKLGFERVLAFIPKA